MAKSLHSREYRLLTELLRDDREKAGFTQQQLADRLGKPQSLVAKYERAERRLDVVEFILDRKCYRTGTVRVVQTVSSNVGMSLTEPWGLPKQSRIERG